MRVSTRAGRIEPFYVMEVAKAAEALARQVAGSEAPMLFLNIGEPDFTAPPLVQEAASFGPSFSVPQKTLKELLGHTRKEVFAGMLVGIAVAFLVVHLWPAA